MWSLTSFPGHVVSPPTWCGNEANVEPAMIAEAEVDVAYCIAPYIRTAEKLLGARVTGGSAAQSHSFGAITDL